MTTEAIPIDAGHVPRLIGGRESVVGGGELGGLPLPEARYLPLLDPGKLWGRQEVLGRLSPVPKKPGVYAWYFKGLGGWVQTEGCVQAGGASLLYVGIAPKRDPENGAAPSKQRLWNRVRYHFRGNAEGSTLRLTLGCLLSDHLGIELRRVGSGERMTFASGEETLNLWLQENAFVTWVEAEAPWELERSLIQVTPLPLNWT